MKGEGRTYIFEAPSKEIVFVIVIVKHDLPHTAHDHARPPESGAGAGRGRGRGVQRGHGGGEGWRRQETRL